MATQTTLGTDIFFVDDEPVIAHTLGLILSQVGYCIRVSNDPSSVRLHLRNSSRLFISDHQLLVLPALNWLAEEVPCTKVLLFGAPCADRPSTANGAEKTTRREVAR